MVCLYLQWTAVVLMLESQVVEMSEDLLLFEVFVMSVTAVAGLHSPQGFPMVLLGTKI
jgi:hypothetical protein